MTLRTQDAANLTGLKESTIRAWTRGEWAQYLTKGAQGDGKRRAFTELDIDILSHVNRLKSELSNTDEIHAALKQLQDDDWKALPSVARPEKGQAVVTVVPEDTANARLDEIRRSHNREVILLQDRIDTLEERLEEKDRLHKEERIKLETELRETREQLGTAQGRLTELENTDARVTRLWVALLVAVTVAALVVAALALIMTSR